MTLDNPRPVTEETLTSGSQLGAAPINFSSDCGAALIFHRIVASETPTCVLIKQPAAVAPDRQLLTIERRVGRTAYPSFGAIFYRRYEKV
jgi:hypothetical protein